jgi:hypothetical protein
MPNATETLCREFDELFSPWRYESDGDIGNRTHYCVRTDITKPFGVDRLDFKTKKQAVDFAKNANRLIFNLLNT